MPELGILERCEIHREYNLWEHELGEAWEQDCKNGQGNYFSEFLSIAAAWKHRPLICVYFPFIWHGRRCRDIALSGSISTVFIHS